jgi:ketosteroid isomerase-like protein
MTLSAQALLTDIYDAWRTQNLDLLATYLPDDFSHFINIPTDIHPLGEVRHGKVAVIERLELIFQQFDVERLEASQMAVNNNSATVEVRKRCRHRQSGAVLDLTRSDLWTLEEGWPVKLFEHYDLDRFRAFMKSAQAMTPRSD